MLVKIDSVWKAYRSHNVLGVKEWIINKKSLANTHFDRKWSLQDVNLTINSSSSVGIMGHNGAGKSTLLNLILGTIQQDYGYIVRNCKIGAMLELGAGFHPDLTGVENIILSSSLNGNSINHTKSALESIIDFSELGSSVFLPLRTYSAGMSARLAFSILACTNFDLLVIDEVLAVGDASFQTKCGLYLKDFIKRGGTLVIASHNLGALKDLCSYGLCLHQGSAIYYGEITSAISHYNNIIQDKTDNHPI
jgi:lipopolysaccharide transport system ATP-binding protein